MYDIINFLVSGEIRWSSLTLIAFGGLVPDNHGLIYSPLIQEAETTLRIHLHREIFLPSNTCRCKSNEAMHFGRLLGPPSCLLLV